MLILIYIYTILLTLQYTIKYETLKIEREFASKIIYIRNQITVLDMIFSYIYC